MRIISLLLMPLFPVWVYAQTLTGRVVDKDSIAIPFANVTLFSSTDSSFIQGVVTHEDGTFLMEAVPAGGLLRVSSVGYATKFMANSGGNVGDIVLTEDTKTLGEVVVKGERPQYKTTPGGISIDIQNSILGNVGTADNVISMMPYVEGSDGKFTVFAKGTPEIYIDNRKIQDPKELKLLKSSDIKSIDIITSPGARYNAEVSSVIRIKTIRGTGNGISVAAFSDVEYNHKWTTYDDATLRYHKDGLELSGTLSVVNNNYAEDNTVTTDTRTNGNEINIIQVCPNDYWYTTVGGKLGANYDFGKDNLVGASYNLDGSIYEGGNAYTEQTITRNGTFEGFVNQRMSILASDNPRHEINLYYLGRAGKLGIDFSGTWLWKKTSRDQVSYEQSEQLDDRTIHSYNTNRNRLLAAKMILTYPVWRGELSLGSEASRTNSHGLYTNTEQILASTDDEIRESNIAVFAEYHARLGNWQLDGGLRYESVKSHYYAFGDLQPDQSRNYDDLFPNVSIGWQHDRLGVQLSYEKRISRPSYNSLRSNVQYDNRYSYEGGNPLLRPTIKQEVDLSLTYGWLSFTAGYSHGRDVRLMFGDLYRESSEITIWRSMNFDRQESYNASLALSPKIGFYKPTLSISYWQQHFDASSYGVAKRMNRPLWRLDFRNWFEIGRSLKGMLHFRCSSDYDDGFTRYAKNFAVNARLQKTLLKQSLTLTLYANDIFRQTNERWMGYYTVTSTSKDAYTYTRGIGLTISYTFNNSLKSKYRGTGAGNSEKDRL